MRAASGDVDSDGRRRHMEKTTGNEDEVVIAAVSSRSQVMVVQDAMTIAGR